MRTGAMRRRLVVSTMLVSVACAAVSAALVYHRLHRRALLGTRGEDPQAAEILAGYSAEDSYPRVEILYPLDEALFPPEIAAPTFRWKDPNPAADTWLVTVRVEGRRGRLCALPRETRWRPSEEDWEAVKRLSADAPATVLVLGVNHGVLGRVLSAGSVAFRTSTDEVGAPIFYREVNLPFIDAVKDPSRIRWRFGSVASTEQPPIVLQGLPVCGNCHSFSANGSLLGMDVDYANDKGSYVLAAVTPEIVLDKGKIVTWSDYRRQDGEPTFGLLSQVSPDGRFAVSTVKDRSVFVATPGIEFSQLFFPIKGILGVFDRKTGSFAALPGADDRRFVHSNPAWSPDGTHIVFARAEATRLRNDGGKNVLLTSEECEEFLTGGRQFLFDLYRVPFNGGKGGTAEPLQGASRNGMSNFFPKYSPDGRWIVFCKARSFMLLQPDSELYILPAGGGEARRLRCNTPRMNSWHSWSPNGRWLVFSSKANGPYTQLFLAHIDDEGRSSPPILLDRFTEPDRAANIPEFVRLRPDAIQAIREQFVDDHSYVRSGDEALKVGDLGLAARAYRKAIELHPTNADAHANLGVVLLRQRRFEEAQGHLAEAVARKPDDAVCRRNLGDLLVHLNRLPEAMTHYRKALELDPRFTEVRTNVGVLLLMGGRIEEATAEFAEAVRLDPRDASAHFHLGRALLRAGKEAEAAASYRRALDLAPDDVRVLVALATIRAAGKHRRLRNGRDALALATKACSLTGHKSAEPLDVLAAAYAESGDFPSAVATAKQALQRAREAGDERRARDIAARLRLYLQSQAIPAGP